VDEQVVEAAVREPEDRERRAVGPRDQELPGLGEAGRGERQGRDRGGRQESRPDGRRAPPRPDAPGDYFLFSLKNFSAPGWRGMDIPSVAVAILMSAPFLWEAARRSPLAYIDLSIS
jgi:hypothetical protein